MPRPTPSRAPGLMLTATFLLSLVACGGTSAGQPTPGSSASPTAAAPSPTVDPMASGELLVDPCETVHAARSQLEALRAIELRLPDRVALDIELGQLQAVVEELEEADFGPLGEQLEEPLTRLGYRLIDLELAVEDFRTNPRIRPAAAHVEEDAQAFADALEAFAILARC